MNYYFFFFYSSLINSLFPIATESVKLKVEDLGFKFFFSGKGIALKINILFVV